MPIPLKVGTAVTVQMGPALDRTDGVTPETGLTPTVYLTKNGAAFAVRTGVTVAHDRDGFYRVDLSINDTDTLGRLRAQFTDSATHAPVWENFQVMTANAWDSLYGADRLNVNVAEISDSGAAADNLEAVYTTISSAAKVGVLDTGTATGVGASTITLRAGLSASSNNLVGAVVTIEAATTGAYQSRVISGWNNATKVADVDPAWTTTPTGTINYVVFFAAPATTTSPPTVNVTQVAGSTLNSPVSGRIDAYVGAMAANVVTAAALATDAVSEIADGLLDRNMATGADSGTDSTAVRTPRQALRALRNKVTLNPTSGAMVVYKEDDAATSWTSTATTQSRDPIISSDPT
jgi:hypothetical protein